MQRCSRCGEQNDDGVRYCGTCGLPVPNSDGVEPSVTDGPDSNDETARGEAPRSSEYVDAPSFGETGTVSAPSPPAGSGSPTVALPVDATMPGASSTQSEAPPPGPPPQGGFATGAPAPVPVPEVRSTRSTSLMVAALAVAVVVIIGGVIVLLVMGSGENEVARPGQDSVAPATGAPDTADAPVASEVPPAESLPSGTAPAATAGPSEPAVTVAPTAPVRAPGDLGLEQPILNESCDGRYITFVGSAVGDRPYNVAVSELLDLYPGANYIWTRACPSLRQEFTNGAEIYGVVFGPYATEQEACDARAFGPEDAYVRRISTFDPQDHTIGC